MLYAIVAVIALILDQAVKYWTTVKIVVETGRKTLIPGVVHLTNVHNTGAAFSFLSDQPWARWLFILLCVVFAVVVIYVLAKGIISTPGARWSAVFVLAGAVGNCIDRVVCGYVVDMFELEFMTFPVFNVADVFLTLGVIAFCLCVLIEKEPGKKAKAEAAGDAAAADVPDKAGVKADAPDKAMVKKEKKPRRKHTKVQIPDFPKRERPAEPALDPNDPFAEWEHRAGSAQVTDSAPDKPHDGATVYTQPDKTGAAAADDEATKVNIPVVKPKAEKTAAPAPDKPVEPASAEPVSDKSVEPVSAAPAAPAPGKPAAPGNDDSFDLDDILAEFRDL